MRDRYYIFFLLTGIAVLSGWLAAYSSTHPDVLIDDGGVMRSASVSVKTEAGLITSATKKQVLANRVEAATSSRLTLSEELDPIRINGSSQFTTTASSALVLNEKTGAVLWDKNGDDSRAIASITKLFTALVFLDFNPGWDKTYQMKNTDRREGGKVYLWSGEKVSVKDLFYLSLVASGNSETMALVNSTGLGEELFVKKMNEKAKELGLKNTVFLDPVGLNEGNVSTAREVAKFARTALAKQEIAKAVTTDKYRCATKAGRKIAVSSTDELLGDKIDQGLDLDGGKTGYNGRAGYCFVGKFTNAENHPLISVILGEATKKSRFSETMDLVKWAYDSHAWPEKMN
jgi:D-alanyl-D-alanine carboxypeptidase